MNLVEIMQHDDSPMITIDGIGQMTLSQAKVGVQKMLQDLSERVNDLVLTPTAGDQLRWKGIKALLDHGVLQAYVDAVANAQRKQH